MLSIAQTIDFVYKNKKLILNWWIHIYYRMHKSTKPHQSYNTIALKSIIVG